MAYRKPCIDWAEWNKSHGRDFSNPLQAENFARQGCCAKREVPTDAEIAEWKERHDKRIREVLDSLERGIVPPGVIACRDIEPADYDEDEGYEPSSETSKRGWMGDRSGNPYGPFED